MYQLVEHWFNMTHFAKKNPKKVLFTLQKDYILTRFHNHQQPNPILFIYSCLLHQRVLKFWTDFCFRLDQTVLGLGQFLYGHLSVNQLWLSVSYSYKNKYQVLIAIMITEWCMGVGEKGPIQWEDLEKEVGSRQQERKVRKVSGPKAEVEGSRPSSERQQRESYMVLAILRTR